MKKNTPYLVVAALAGVAVFAFLVTGRVNSPESTPQAPVRTSPADLAQLANFTRIKVEGDFSLVVSQVDDYSIEFQPLSESQGTFMASVEDDTLVVTGFDNRTAAAVALVQIGVPVLDTLEVVSLPDITVRNFNAPLMNIQLKVFDRFALEQSVITTLNLISEGEGSIELRGNTLVNQNLRLGELNELRVTD